MTIRTDADTEHALDILTSDGSSRSAVSGGRCWKRRPVVSGRPRCAAPYCRMDLGEPDGVDIADELSRSREDER